MSSESIKSLDSVLSKPALTHRKHFQELKQHPSSAASRYCFCVDVPNHNMKIS